MADILKIWIKAPKKIRVVFALLYVLVSLSISLNHTCNDNGSKPHSCHLNSSVCHFPDDNHPNIYLKTVHNQNYSDSKVLSHSQKCPACTYLLKSKSSKFCSAGSILDVRVDAKRHIVPCRNFTNQFEWLCSNSLRAPPVITIS